MDNEYNNNNNNDNRDDFQNTESINNSQEGLNNNQSGGDAMGETYKYSFEDKTPDNMQDKKGEKYGFLRDFRFNPVFPSF